MSAPVFVFGTGRSGTTVFHRILSGHPDVAWLSNLVDQYPQRLAYHRFLLHLLDVPGLEPILRRRFTPGECYEFWEHYVRGFRTPFRDLQQEDMTAKNQKALLKVFSELTTDNRSQLVLKITGWPRLGFLSGVFEDAKFIHVVRDGRAVANSLLNIDFWRGWGGPEKWRWGPLPLVYQQEWEVHNKSFVALAGIQWKMLMDAAEEAIKLLPEEKVLQVKYEDLCANPESVMQSVAKFSGLPWSKAFQAKIACCKLVSKNTKYQEDLTVKQQEILNAVLHGHLKSYGYMDA